MEICAQRSVGIPPSAAADAARRTRASHTYHTACHVHFLWLAEKMTRQLRISAAESVAVHPHAARAQAECLRYLSAGDIAVFEFLLKTRAALHDAPIGKDGRRRDVTRSWPSQECDHGADFLRFSHATQRDGSVKFLHQRRIFHG